MSQRTETSTPAEQTSRFADPVLAAVMANRFEAIVREMSNTVLRAARSAAISNGRDFSCSLISASNELVAVADGLPVHTFNTHMQAANIQKFHPDLAEGDAFIDNDPYTGNTHPADQAVLVPVFVDGEHLFTACAKAHQADIGNSIPSTYHPFAKDLYNEGAVIFTCMRLQRGYEMVDDVVRMAMRRIRVPEQWRGDLLAALGAARLAETRLKALCAQYGTQTVKQFVVDWLDYSEEVMAARIAKLPKARLHGTGRHDPVPGVIPEGIPLGATIEIDPDQREIVVDLRDNPDCVPAGFNQSEATAISNAMAGIYHSLGTGVPRNSGAFRRLRVLLRENCVVGIPRFPASCSIATTNVGDRMVNLVQSTFAQLGAGHGLAEGGVCMGINTAVVSGKDYRFADKPFISQITLGTNGGPASAWTDGWGTYGIPVSAGLTFRDSVEFNESKFPMLIDHLFFVPGSAGAGEHRGGLAIDIQYRARSGEITVASNADGHRFAPLGVRGGQPGSLGYSEVVGQDGQARRIEGFAVTDVRAGEAIHGTTNGGGGYGSPLKRRPEAVLEDVLEHRETLARALDVYGVVITGDAAADTLAVDAPASERLRAQRTAAEGSGHAG